jgi:3-hydroxyacyl-CoA dehydrogenase
MPVPELVTAVGEGNFYRNQDSTLESFGHSGRYNTISRAEGVLGLSDIKREGDRIAGNSAASAWDLGDQVLCLEFHTKMNSLDAEVFKVISEVITLIPAKGFQALVIYNEGNNFSVGVNLGQALFAANLAGWSEIGKSVKQGQDIYQALKYAPFPVVGAPSGMALGGGCEVLLHCDAIQAHAETYLGLVEVGVGLVPAWGGCKEMLLRWMNNPKHPQGPMAAVGKVFETIGMANVSRSAEEARDLLFLRPTDNISMNRDRLLADAKAMARRLAVDYSPPTPPEIRLPGPSGRAAMTMAVRDLCKAGKATSHDQVVTSQLAYVLSGGEADPTVPVNEADVLRLERNAIMALLKTPGTLARMEHMLESGKPLRN